MTAPRPFPLRPVQPSGSATSPAFVDYADGTGEYRDITLPRYPPSPRGEAFRRARVDGPSYCSLGMAGRVLGLRASEVSGLETGRLEMEREEDWERARGVVREWARGVGKGEAE